MTAAVTAFARNGYAGTTTEQVARLAGVSQPYVIRLFGTKRALFLAAMAHATDRIEQRFRDAAAEHPGLAGLCGMHDELPAERDLMVLLLQGCAAATDPAVGPAMRDHFGRIHHTIRRLTGAGEDATRDVLATGMLWAILSAMQIVGPDPVPREPWMEELIRGINDP